MTASFDVPNESFVLANGLRHHVLAWGPERGETILLCHGFLDVAWSWAFVATRLARAGHRVLAFDWRGHGETDRVGPGGYYHFQDYALDLELLTPMIAPDGFHLVGHSMGGTACAQWSGTRPAGLRSLTLMEGVGPPDMPAELAPDRIRAFLDSVKKTRAKDARPLRDLDDVIARLRTQHGALDDELARFVAEKHTGRDASGALFFRFDPLHRTTSPRVFRVDEMCALLARIEVPVLLLTGQHGWVNADHARRVAAIQRPSERTIEGVGHMMHWLAPDAVADAILAHVRGQ